MLNGIDDLIAKLDGIRRVTKSAHVFAHARRFWNGRDATQRDDESVVGSVADARVNDLLLEINALDVCLNEMEGVPALQRTQGNGYVVRSHAAGGYVPQERHKQQRVGGVDHEHRHVCLVTQKSVELEGRRRSAESAAQNENPCPGTFVVGLGWTEMVCLRAPRPHGSGEHQSLSGDGEPGSAQPNASALSPAHPSRRTSTAAKRLGESSPWRSANACSCMTILRSMFMPS